MKAWSEQRRSGASKKRPEIISHLKKKHRRNKLANTVTIDSVYEKNFLSLNSVLEAVIVDERTRGPTVAEKVVAVAGEAVAGRG